MRYVLSLAPILSTAIVLGALCWLPAPPPTRAQTDPGPSTCRIGAYLTNLHAFAPDADTFDADLWLWSVCPEADRQPLETMEFVNADEVEVLLDVIDDPSWASRKVRGTFLHDWDERNFPFDHHRLQIVLEEGDEDVRRSVYEPDTANSRASPSIQLPGWRMTDFAMRASTTTYYTTFGDPSLSAGGSSDYSRVTLEIGLARADLSGFFKLTAVVYAAFGLSLITYVIQRETTAVGPKVGLLAGALFTTAVNLVTASSALGSASGLSLVDKIHVVVIVYILLAAVVAVVSRVLEERGWEAAAIVRLNSRVGLGALISFVAVNALLIALAARGG
jgi:hypothetical protein